MRKILILLGMIITTILGVAYSWSIFRKPLEELFSISAMESGLPYMAFLVAFTATMPFAGGLINKIGPRATMIIGTLVLGIGWISSGFANGIFYLTVSYGILGGIGVGITYGVPLAIAARWFPDKKGFALGLIILGFGFSPVILAPVSRYLITAIGALKTLSLLGVIFCAIITLCSLPLRFPKKDELKDFDKIDENKIKKNLNVKEMLKERSFYGLWICYTIGTFVGLMIIGISGPFAEEVINLDFKTAALTVALFGVFNGLGRPIFGFLTDKMTVKYSSVLTYLIIIAASLGIILAKEKNLTIYILTFSSLWMILGGWLAIAPTATASLFGMGNYSRNYGVVFSAHGTAAVIGTIVSGTIKELSGSYMYVFYPIIAISVVGIIVAMVFLGAKKTSA